MNEVNNINPNSNLILNADKIVFSHQVACVSHYWSDVISRCLDGNKWQETTQSRCS